MCLIVDDFVEGRPGELYLTKKAYCIMSKYRYYELHINLLHSILNFKKLESLNILALLNGEEGLDDLVY